MDDLDVYQYEETIDSPELVDTSNSADVAGPSAPKKRKGNGIIF